MTKDTLRPLQSTPPGILGLALMLTLTLFGCEEKPVEASLGADGVQTAKVTVKHGYHPAHIQAQAGKPLKLEFYRDEEQDASCVQDLVIPSENVNVHLPIHQSHIVNIKAQPAGDIEFYCGMKMMKGKITFK